MISSMLYPREIASRRVVSLVGMWRFRFDPKTEGVDASKTTRLPAPCSMPIPSSFNDVFTVLAKHRYQSVRS